MNFHGETRTNDTHQSTSDPDAQLARKGPGKEAKLSYAGHVLLDHRHGLVANVCATAATGTAEREAALLLLGALRHGGTVGGDKGFDVPGEFLLLNLALAFYAVGAIWAHEIDIFRSWTLLDPDTFRHLQQVHWRKLPYWVFIPIGLMFAGAIALVWYHPATSPSWAVWGALACQLASHVLTGATWGPWQAKLSKDDRGASSPYLAKILSTHWIRTLLINVNGAIMLAWATRVFA